MGGLLKRLRRRSPLGVFRDRSGIGAVEFAMVMPFLLALYLGASELTFGITADRKVNNAASTISDLVTQNAQTSVAQLQLMTGLSKALIAPFDADRLEITITQVAIDEDRQATVDWSSNPVRYEKAMPFVGLPAGIANQAERYVIVTETVYGYEPVAGFGVLGEFAMKRTAYNQPRTTPRINCEDCE